MLATIRSCRFIWLHCPDAARRDEARKHVVPTATTGRTPLEAQLSGVRCCWPDNSCAEPRPMRRALRILPPTAHFIRTFISSTGRRSAISGKLMIFINVYSFHGKKKKENNYGRVSKFAFTFFHFFRLFAFLRRPRRSTDLLRVVHLICELGRQIWFLNVLVNCITHFIF